MGSQAIVVGCDAYPRVAGGDLAGAVSDARSMRDWLTDPAGGRLAASDVQLLASPSSRGAVPPASAASAPATVADFLGAIEHVAQRPATADDRLFVYFAGHGSQTDPQNQSVSEDALVFSEFDPRQPSAGCVGVAALEQRLRALDYGEFFILCDACRDFPFEDPFRLGGFGFDARQRKVRPYHPRGHIFQAALPGGQAKGVEIDGLVSGQFTAAVLEGLAGAGTAKWFNPTAELPRYEVTWDRLCTWVQQRLGTPLNAPADGNPVLCSFEDGWFSDIKLNVAVDPAQAGGSSGTEVKVEFDNFVDPGGGALVLPGPFPYRQPVPPRRHRIFGRQAGLDWGIKVVDAYTDTDVQLVLPDQPPGLVTRSARQGIIRVTRGASAWLPVRVHVTTGDPATVVEVTDLGGTRAAIGVGAIDADLKPGSYVARLLLPGLLPAEYPLEVLGGDTGEQTLDLDAEPGRGRPQAPDDVPAALVARRLALHGSATLRVTQPVSEVPWEVDPGRRAEVLPTRVQSVQSRMFPVEPHDVLRAGDRVIEIPIIAGIHTDVEFRAPAPLTVRLVDLPLLGSLAGELLVRAQAFRESRMPEASRLLLERFWSLSARSDVARALESGPPPPQPEPVPPGDLTAFLAESWPAGEVLSGQLWAVRSQIISR